MLVLPETFTAADLRVGLTAEFLRDVTEQDVLDFSDNSGDRNPLHVDEEYASGTNYGGRIVHGAFQVGLASAMIGMHLPGKSVLLGSVHARFPSPLRYPNRVRVNGEITAWNAASRSGRLRVTVVELGSGTIAADISLGFTFHEDRK